MELMNNASSITTITPKLIETPEHFILNTQLYEKQTLKPVPMKFYVNNNLANPFMLLQTSIAKTSSYYGSEKCVYYCYNNNEYNNQIIIQDKNSSNTFYTIMHLIGNSSREFQYVYKMQYNELTKKYQIINSFNVANSGNYYNEKGNIRIIYDTGDYFVLDIYTQYYNTTNPVDGYGCISLLNKNSFEYTRLFSSNFNNCFLEAKEDLMYLFASPTNTTNQVLKVNTSTKTCTAIWTETVDSKYMFCNVIKLDNYYYTITTYLENSVYSYKIIKLSLNTTTDTVNTELLDINANGFLMDSSPNSDIASNAQMKYTLRIIKTETDTYLSCLIHTIPNVGTGYAFQHKHVLLKFDGISATIVDIVPLTDGCYGSLIYGDSKHQIYYMSNCILFYNFDETKEKMICSYKKAGMFIQMGFDSLNRFITQTTDYTIEMLTEANACILKADFDEELYDKSSNSELETTVSFYAKNFLDEYLETTVKLTLIGPVVFKDNDTKELIISTSSTDIKSVPVIINGYGKIEVIIVQNT